MDSLCRIMRNSKKYKVEGSEAELENLLGIKSKSELDKIENIALKQAEDLLFQKLISPKHRFKAMDICNMHKIWLGKIYAWAGKYRDVDLTKGVRFAHARHIPGLMEEFEQKFLRQHTPCIFHLEDRVIQALAEVHVELVLIHPFREGNGRLTRILSSLMGLQAGLPPFDFTSIEKGAGKQRYFNAIQAGFEKNYEPMKKIFRKIIEKTLSRSSEKGK